MGDAVLVYAAASGVGLLLVELAKRRGARVIGTVSTEEKMRLAQEAGADNSKGSLFLTRPSRSDYTMTRAELLQRVNDLFRWLASEELQVRIDRVFPLIDVATAHRYLKDRQPKGKVLLLP